MKKISVLSLCLVIFNTAIAADNVGDSCSMTGAISQVGNKVMSCDNKWKLVGEVGTAPIKLAVKLMESDKLNISTKVSTIDGQPVSVVIGKEQNDIISSGFFMTLIPTLAKDGKIEVQLIASKSDAQSDVDTKSLQEKTINIKQTFSLENNKEFNIPFGPLVKSIDAHKPAHTQYTLKLLASKD